MPRPQRIEIENGWYYVNNRAARGNQVFENAEQSQLFLSLLAETIKLYGIEVHAYCLLPQTYHLLVHTPKANLSQAMRHLNGLYTQRVNKLRQLDGPIFRGRYKATIIEEDYILALGRYIHLQPVESKLARTAEQFKWSSYRNYLGKSSEPTWLHCGKLSALCDDVANYTAAGNEDVLTHFFSQRKQSPVLGGLHFKQMLINKTQQNINLSSAPLNTPSIENIMQATAKHFNVDQTVLQQSRRGQTNLPRATAIYLSRKVGGHILTRIADLFSGISHAAIGTTVKRFDELLEKDNDLKQHITTLTKQLATEET